MTCSHFGPDQICTQVKASFSPFGHPIQVNASWVASIHLLVANEIEGSFLATCVYLRGNFRVGLATQRKSLRKFNVRSLATTCLSVFVSVLVFSFRNAYYARFAWTPSRYASFFYT